MKQAMALPPLCAVYTFDGNDRLAGERIYYDRATVLGSGTMTRLHTHTPFLEHRVRTIMTTSRLFLSILFIGLSALLVETSFAQDVETVEASAEETIRALEDQERLAVLNRDTVSLERIWSENFMVNTPTNRISHDPSVPLASIRTGVIDYSSFERSIEALRIDGDLAIVMGAETIIPTGNAPGAGQTVQRRFTHVWRKDGETWRLLVRHANILLPE